MGQGASTDSPVKNERKNEPKNKIPASVPPHSWEVKKASVELNMPRSEIVGNGSRLSNSNQHTVPSSSPKPLSAIHHLTEGALAHAEIAAKNMFSSQNELMNPTSAASDAKRPEEQKDNGEQQSSIISSASADSKDKDKDKDQNKDGANNDSFPIENDNSVDNSSAATEFETEAGKDEGCDSFVDVNSAGSDSSSAHEGHEGNAGTSFRDSEGFGVGFGEYDSQKEGCELERQSSTNVHIDPETEYELNTRMTIADFDLLKVLGKGSFGKVMLVRRKGKLYALKSLRKAKLVQRHQLGHTATERTVLQEIHCPFLVHLCYAFQTVEKLYMVLDYVGGGELFFWLKKEKRFSENRCRLYAAEISIALECMHQANIVYRDLKPENVLLDSAGHVKLTDFGLAKSGVYSMNGTRGTMTFCGTPEYLAPEILHNKGHGKAVDWWALGTLMYEMMVGLPPFYDQNTQKMYTKILLDPLLFPKAANRQLLPETREMLAMFLDRKIATRLGSNGVDDEFKSIAFFKPLHFDLVERREYMPEFKPPANINDCDVSNFDEEFTRETAADSLVTSRMTNTMEEKSVFQGFTYKPSA